MSRLSVTHVEPDAAAPRRKHRRQNVAGVIDDAVGRRREHVGDDIAAFQEIEQPGKRRHRLSHVDHDGKGEGGGHFLRAPKHLVIIRARDIS